MRRCSGACTSIRPPPVALRQSWRSFYAGLDDSRVHRLRRSGITFNRPRGRDPLSVAFENRIRLVPCMSVGDLYRPVKAAEIHVADRFDVEHPLAAKRAKEGDERMQSLRTESIQKGAQIMERRDWRVMVVDATTLEQVEKAVDYPAVHRHFYSDWGKGDDAPDGKREDVWSFHTDQPVLTREEPTSSDSNTMRRFSSQNKRHLRQNGDTTLLPGRLVRANPRDSTHMTATYYLSVCVDPFLDVERYHRQEAQVEMISAFRNIMYEAAEIGMDKLHREVAPPVDIVRIPALSCFSAGRRFHFEIGKLNQQSLIKGFHRLSNECKERLLLNPAFTVELHVPPLLLPQFEAAFLEEAWEVPTSTLNPGRTALYPGLAPPRSLVDLEGWVGKRPELLEAIRTGGRNLLRGPQHNLDGTEVVEEEVLAHMKLLGARADQEARLEGERRTAAEENLLPDTQNEPLLHTGLQQP